MKKTSIFHRIYRSYAISNIVLLLVVAVSLRLVVNGTVVSQEKKNLARTSQVIAPLLEFNYLHGDKDARELRLPESEMENGMSIVLLTRQDGDSGFEAPYVSGELANDFMGYLNLELDSNGKVSADGQILNDINGSPYIYHAQCLQDPGEEICLIVATNRSYLNAAINRAWFSLLIALIPGIIAAGLMAWYLASTFSQPLELMRKTAQRFGKGDFSRKVPHFPNFELSDLGDALNQMARLLDARINEITSEKNEKVAILESLNEGVLAIDQSERIVSINNIGAGMLGVNANEVQGTLVQDFLRHVDLQKFIQESLKGNYTQDDDFARTISVGEGTLVQVRNAPLRNSEGDDIGLIIIFADITRLTQLENLRRDFVANVSHELRTPITSIRGYTETLLDGALEEDPGQCRNFLEVIDRQANRLGQVIEDLLRLSRLEQSEQIVREALPIDQFMRQTIEICQDEAQKSSTELLLECDSTRMIMINETLMEQALSNLIFNAIRYGGGEGKSVRVTVFADSNKIIFRVIDEGPGIEEEHQARLFERFYRIDKARSRDVGGTGLGLSIVKHVAVAHHGRVSVESKIGKGTTFIIEVPAKDQENGDHEYI